MARIERKAGTESDGNIHILLDLPPFDVNKYMPSTKDILKASARYDNAIMSGSRNGFEYGGDGRRALGRVEIASIESLASSCRGTRNVVQLLEKSSGTDPISPASGAGSSAYTTVGSPVRSPSGEFSTKNLMEPSNNGSIPGTIEASPHIIDNAGRAKGIAQMPIKEGITNITTKMKKPNLSGGTALLPYDDDLVSETGSNAQSVVRFSLLKEMMGGSVGLELANRAFKKYVEKEMGLAIVGAVIRKVTPDSWADKSGLQQGDVIQDVCVVLNKHSLEAKTSWFSSDVFFALLSSHVFRPLTFVVNREAYGELMVDERIRPDDGPSSASARNLSRTTSSVMRGSIPDSSLGRSKVEKSSGETSLLPDARKKYESSLHLQDPDNFFETLLDCDPDKMIESYEEVNLLEPTDDDENSLFDTQSHSYYSDQSDFRFLEAEPVVRIIETHKPTEVYGKQLESVDVLKQAANKEIYRVATSFTLPGQSRERHKRQIAKRANPQSEDKSRREKVTTSNREKPISPVGSLYGSPHHGTPMSPMSGYITSEPTTPAAGHRGVQGNGNGRKNSSNDGKSNKSSNGKDYNHHDDRSNRSYNRSREDGRNSHQNGRDTSPFDRSDYYIERVPDEVFPDNYSTSRTNNFKRTISSRQISTGTTKTNTSDETEYPNRIDKKNYVNVFARPNKRGEKFDQRQRAVIAESVQIPGVIGGFSCGPQGCADVGCADENGRTVFGSFCSAKRTDPRRDFLVLERNRYVEEVKV